MAQRKNIVILKTEQTVQTEIAKGIYSDFQRKYPEYEVVIIDDMEYLGWFNRIVKRCARRSRRLFPKLYAKYRAWVCKRRRTKLENFGKIFQHFSDPSKIKEGSSTGCNAMHSIFIRYKPKCMVALDSGIMATLVAAKRKYELNTKIVSVLTNGWFDETDVYFGVNQYAVMNGDIAKKLVECGMSAAQIDEVKMFELQNLRISKSTARHARGMENDTTFLLLPTMETRKEFYSFIRQLADINAEFNILVHCGENVKLEEYFSEIKVRLDLFRMKLSEEFEENFAVADYVVCTPNIRALYRCFDTGALALVYHGAKLPQNASPEFYLKSGLVIPIEQESTFGDTVKGILSSISAETEINQKVQQYIHSLPEKSAADTVFAAAKKLDAEQEI